MFYIVFDFMMAVIMFLFGMWFYKSEGKAAKFLSGYNMKSADERKKYDENAMCKAYPPCDPTAYSLILDIYDYSNNKRN